MKSKKMLSLLTAAALSGGVITAATVTPSVVAAAETMADQYQPYYDDSAVRAVPWVYLSPQSESGLPYGTTFSLFDHTSYDPTLFTEDAVMVSLSPSSGNLQVWFNSGYMPNPGITTTSFRVVAYYPDGSSEIFRVTLNLIPEDTHAYDAAYSDAYVRIGSGTAVEPYIRNYYDEDFPDGTSFSMTGYYEVDARCAEGWMIELDRTSGVITVEVPEDAPENSVEIPIVVTYPDGSKDSTSTTVFAEGPNDAELYTPSFERITVDAGITGGTDALAAGLPNDTAFYLSDLWSLSDFFDAGGSISISWDGTFTVDVPVMWTEDLVVPLFVLFPDGSSTTSDLEIDVLPADQNKVFDLQFEQFQIQAGTTEIIHSVGNPGLPTDTSIEIVEDESLDALRATGWEFSIVDNLNISVVVPADATNDVSVNIKVVYTDGTSEITPVDVLVNPLFAALYDVEYDEVILNAGDFVYVTPNDGSGGWSYYASVSLDESPELAALRAEGWVIEENGNTGLYITAPLTATTSTTLPLTIHYYDGSTEESQVRITVTPEKQAVLHDVTYPFVTLTAGDALTVFPENTDLPDGTMLFLSQDQNLEDARNAGWTIDNYLSGEFFITAPITATDGIQLTFQVNYPDGTEEKTPAWVNVNPANHAGNHDVTYPAAIVNAGDTATITPDTTGLPSGTIITLADNADVTAARTAGWVLEVDTHGVLTVSVPITATNGMEVTFLVSYPDGTQEEISVLIEITAANQADNHEVTYPATTINAGDTTTITPDTTNLPTGVTMTLVEDLFLADARNAGWEIETDANGVITAFAPVSSTSGTTVSVLVTYPDGTREQVFAQIEVITADHADNHNVSYPVGVIMAGDSTTITPDTTALPTGTTITLVEDANLSAAHAAGWTFTITASGKITASTIDTTVGRVVINVRITYPDGTSETTAVDISAIAKPVVEDPEGDDPIDVLPAPKAGGSSFGSS